MKLANYNIQLPNGDLDKKVYHRQMTANKRARRDREGLCTECGGVRDRQGKICSLCYSLGKQRTFRFRSNSKQRFPIKVDKATNKQLATLMVINDITAEELAIIIGVSSKSVQRWLYGGGGISPKHHECLEMYFKTKIELW